MNLPQNTAYARGIEYSSSLPVYRKYNFASLLCIFETAVCVLYKCKNFMAESGNYKQLGEMKTHILARICIQDATDKLKFTCVSRLLNSTAAKRNCHLERKTLYQCSVALPHGAVGWSVDLWLWYFLIILTCFFSRFRTISFAFIPQLVWYVSIERRKQLSLCILFFCRFCGLSCNRAPTSP